MGRFDALKQFDFVIKESKFQQTKLMGAAVSDDYRLTLLFNALVQVTTTPEQRAKYVTDVGACAVFSARWLSEVLGTHETEIRSRNPDLLTVTQCMIHNAELKQGESENFLDGLFRLHGLMSLAELSDAEAKNLNELADGHLSYWISCLETGKSGHAIAYTANDGGRFFDPNAGEYLFVGASPQQKKQFFAKWLQINKNNGFNYENFLIFPVLRDPTL